METRDSLRFLPRLLFPIVDIPNTSPTTYPCPPLAAECSEIVAPIATPFSIKISALAFLPLLVILTSSTLLYSRVPEEGVNPIPALMIFRSPVAIPALPTKSPEALLPCWMIVLPRVRTSS